MASTSGTPSTPPAFNQTAIAIGVSLVIATVAATLLTGNPLRAMVLAYTDYSHTPASGAPKASTTTAPETTTQGNTGG